MKRVAPWVLAACLSTPVLAAVSVPKAEAPQTLGVARIVERNVAARGGLDAWRKVETMVWSGHVETADGQEPAMPYVLEMKRPDKTRFAIITHGQVNVRMFDGVHGWTMHPTPGGAPQLKPFTAGELRFARDEPGIGGSLIGYPENGVTVTLDGIDPVEGSPAYRLGVRLPSGESHHVWIDAKSFLEVKADRQSQDSSGGRHTVQVYYRNYQTTTGGLQIPFVIETRAGSIADRMVIEKVAINTPLSDGLFSGPARWLRRPGLGVDGGIQPVAGRAFRPGAHDPSGRSAPAPGAVSGAGHAP
jgi:hypothetical protein